MSWRVFKEIIALFCCLCFGMPSLAQVPEPRVPAIAIDAALLDPIDAIVKEIQIYADKFETEKLSVSYSDGKAIEQWRVLLAKQSRLALNLSQNLRQGDSIALAVILSQTLWSIRDSMSHLSDQFQVAGNNSTSASSTRAAIPLVQFADRLAGPLNDLDTRVQEIATIGDDAVRLRSAKEPPSR